MRRHIDIGGNQGRGNPVCHRAMRGGIWMVLAALVHQILRS